MRAQSGFTLIELIIVIMILGILAATAIPKISNYQTEARKASLATAHAAVKTATTTAHLKFLVAPATTQIDGVTVGFTAEGYVLYTYVPALAGLSSNDYAISSIGGVTTISPAGTPDPSHCAFSYQMVGNGVPLLSAPDTASC